MALAEPARLPPPPPPPSPRGRRGPLLAAGGIGIALGVLATIGVVTLTDDDTSNPADVVTTDDAGRAATPAAPGDEATNASPPTTTEPLPDPTHTSLDDVLYPGDVAALRQMLDRHDFPSWWWLPDAVALAGDPHHTVQSIVSEDTLLDDGVTVSGSSERSTTWYLPTTDLAAMEATVLASIPADAFDVEEAKATRSYSETAGRAKASYIVYEPGSFVNHLVVWVEQVGSFDLPAPDGIDVTLTWQTQVERPPSTVPTGPGEERAFLAAAPSAGFMRWHGTKFNVTSVRDIGTSGSYEAWHTAPVDDFDRVIAFLSNPDNFPGQLQLVQPGQFTLPTFWEQPMAWGDFLGEYSISKTSTGSGNDLFITLTFPLTD